MYAVIEGRKVSIPKDWSRVESGRVQRGDRFWSPPADAWRTVDGDLDFAIGVEIKGGVLVIRRDAAGGEG